MYNDDSPEYYAAKIAALQGSLAEKRQEMKEYLKELRRMFSALKTKVKKYEKIILTLDEERDKTSILVASSHAQLALNKYPDVEKRIVKCMEQKNYFEKGYRELPLHATQSDFFLDEKIKRILSYHRDFKYLIGEAENKIRIAHKHLKRADDHFAFLRKLRR